MNFTVYDRNQYEKGFIDGCKNYTVAFRAELAKEIFEEIETLIKNNCLTITDDRGIKGYVDSSVHFAIAELKKKYTE